MLYSYLQSFSPRAQPWITRQSYTHELQAAMLLPWAIAMTEAGVVGVLAVKSFHVSAFEFSLIMASPFLANVTSFLWARLARGRSKVKTIVLLLLLMLISLSAVALLPTDPLGAMLLTALVVFIRCLLSGLVTIRSTIWRMNYPKSVRGQVTGKLLVITSLIMTAAPLIGFILLDYHPQAFRFIYPCSALIALFGVFHFSRIRVRGEKKLLQFENQPSSSPQPHGALGSIYEYDPKAQPSAWAVLRHDALFRNYMMLQFLMGASNMMGMTVLIYLVAKMTQTIAYDYFFSILITTGIPMLVAIICMPYWARFLDRVHIVEFRIIHCLFFIANFLAIWLGAYWGSLLILALSRVLAGVALSGGQLAWSLGHNDFASRRLVTLYMGIHLTLTGVRGAIFPFLGMLLYTGWSAKTIPFSSIQLPGFVGMGVHVFLLCIVMLIASFMGAVRLTRQVRRQRQAASNLSSFAK